MQITIAKLWPLEGKANGGFKGTDGNTYKCDAGTHGLLSEGITFESNVKPSEWQGKTFYWLPKGFKPVVTGAPTNGHVANNGIQQSANAHLPSNGSRADGFRSPRQMFISEVVSRAMGNGTFNAGDIELLTQKAGEAWDLYG